MMNLRATDFKSFDISLRESVQEQEIMNIKSIIVLLSIIQISFYNWSSNASTSNNIYHLPFTIYHSKAPGWEERTDWPDDYPRPPKTEKSLFFIQRNLNTNTIVYDLDYNADGTFNRNHPIDAYWLRYGSDGSRQDLSWLQAVLAYGYTSRKVKKNIRIKLKAYKDRYIQLQEVAGKWKAFMTINGQSCYLSNIYVYADESGVFPDVKYVDIYGLNPITGSLEKERILNE